MPGIDFTNDPLLQGRNFSYLDSQLKRLGSPNFTQLPINSPKCPYAILKQDGHMATVNPAGRRGRATGGPGHRVPQLPVHRGGGEAAASAG